MLLVIDFDDSLLDWTRRQLRARNDAEIISAASQPLLAEFQLDDGRSLDAVVEFITGSSWKKLNTKPLHEYGT